MIKPTFVFPIMLENPDEKDYSEISLVSKNLYVGNLLAARDTDMLKVHGVTSVVTVLTGVDGIPEEISKVRRSPLLRLHFSEA